MEMKDVNQFRLLLLGDAEDSSADALIELIYQMAVNRMLFLISVIRKGFELPELEKAEIPEELEWILTEVVVKRFNKIGMEGFTSQRVEGHDVTIDTGDFSEYLKDLSNFYDPYPQKSRKGKVVMF